MPTNHIVVQGECLSSLAHQYKFASWQEIYDDPNNADLKAKRPNPNVLYPGDHVYIADPKQREESKPTGLRHIFVVSLPPVYLNIRMLDVEDEPISNARYELKFDVITLNGSTDGDGWIRSKIPIQAELGTLTVWPNPGDQEITLQWDVRLGHLDPPETISGVKGRLNNLGYICGEVNNVQDESYHAAVRQFEQDNAADDGTSMSALLNKEHLV